MERTDAEKLHVAARQYLIKRHAYWTGKYAKLVQGVERLRGWRYSDEELSIFPRYNVLSAILIGVEGFDPSHFISFDEARNAILAVAQSAESIFTQGPHGLIENTVMAEEREAFRLFVENYSEDNVAQEEPLFYRRVLSPSESEDIWDKVQSRWGVIRREYWYPLIDRTNDNIEAFQDKSFEKVITTDGLRAILANHGLTRVFELRESGVEYELDLSVAFDPYYNGDEGYWCAEQADWIIYASHESSITLGGWLLDEIKHIWPDWRQHIWITPFF
jgi:hypothetical protein